MCSSGAGAPEERQTSDRGLGSWSQLSFPLWGGGQRASDPGGPVASGTDPSRAWDSLVKAQQPGQQPELPSSRGPGEWDGTLGPSPGEVGVSAPGWAQRKGQRSKPVMASRGRQCLPPGDWGCGRKKLRTQELLGRDSPAVQDLGLLGLLVSVLGLRSTNRFYGGPGLLGH